MKEIGEASRWDRRGRRWCTIFGIVSAVFLVFRTEASALDTIYMAITPGKNFQHVIYPIAQEKDYMWEEGIDLKLLIIGATPSIQGLIAGSIQFTVAGTSALIAAAKGAAPLKVVLAANDKVHQWLLSKPDITSPKSLKGKRYRHRWRGVFSHIHAEADTDQARPRPQSRCGLYPSVGRNSTGSPIVRIGRRDHIGGPAALYRRQRRNERADLFRKRGQEFLGDTGNVRPFH